MWVMQTLVYNFLHLFSFSLFMYLSIGCYVKLSDVIFTEFSVVQQRPTIFKCHSNLFEFMLTSLITGWILRFNLGPSLFVSPVRIFCNHPTKKSEPFDRNKYNELKWNSPSGSKIDRHDVFAEVHINTAGSFNYYFTADGRFVQDIYLSFCFSKIKTLTLLKWTNFTIPCIEKNGCPQHPAFTIPHLLQQHKFKPLNG